MFTMNFEFQRGVESSIPQINSALASMRLSSLHLKEGNGYMFTSKTYDEYEQVLSTVKGYEFDMVSFSCEQDENEELETWQIEAVIESKDEVNSNNVFRERWRSEHPDRTLRMLQMIDFGAEPDLAFVVLYSVKN